MARSRRTGMPAITETIAVAMATPGGESVLRGRAFRHVHAASTRFGHSSFAGYRLLFRKINRLREGLILKRVVKRHLLGARIRENAAKARGEGVVQTIIGPESEDTAGAQMCGKPGEPLLAVESGVLRIEQKVGGMIKVVRAALQGAASVAGLVITTEAMVAELPKKQSPAMPGGPGGGMDF